MSKDKQSNNFIKNICFHIIKANGLVKSKKYDEAVKEFVLAIEKDPHFSEIAHYNKAYCLIAKYGGDSWFKSLDKSKISTAQNNIIQARILIKKRILELQIIQRANLGPNLSDQVRHKMTLYNAMLSTIQQAIGVDEDELKSELKQLRESHEKIQYKINGNKLEEKVLTELNTKLEDFKIRIDQIEKEIEEHLGGIIGKALNGKCDIRINLKELNQCLPIEQNVQFYKDELDEFISNGMLGCFNISELQPIPWKDVCLMALIGLVQIAIGTMLTVFSLGAGSNIGSALVLEGVNDLFSSLKDGLHNRHINWESWRIQKAVSLTVSLILCGVGGIKDAAKTAEAGIVTVTETVVTETVVTETTEIGLKLALENASFQIAKGAGREMINVLADEIMDQTLLNQIEKCLINRLQPNIYAVLNKNKNIRRFLAIDNKYQSLILQEALDLFSKKRKNGLDFAEVGKIFATRIASAKIKGFGMVLQLFEAGTAIKEFIDFEQKFIKSLEDSIEKLTIKYMTEIEEKETLSNEYNQLSLSSRETINIGTLSNEDTDDININKIKEPQQQTTHQKETPSIENMCNVISKSVSNEMINLIKSKIIMPVTHVAVNFGVDKVVAGIEQNLAHKIKIYRDDRVSDFMNSGDVDNRVPDEIKIDRANDPQFMAEARQLAINDIKKLENGGEAGTLEMYALSEAINKKIIIYNKNGEIWKVINSHLKGDAVKVEYHPPQNGDQAHWTLPGGKEPLNQSSENNCLFNVVADQTGIKPEDLRVKTVTTMTINIDRYAIVMPEVEYVRQYKSEWHMYGGAGEITLKVKKLQNLITNKNKRVVNFNPDDEKTEDEIKNFLQQNHNAESNNPDTIVKLQFDLKNPTKRKSIENIKIRKTGENQKITDITANANLNKDTIKKKGDKRLNPSNNKDDKNHYVEVGIYVQDGDKFVKKENIDITHLVPDCTGGSNSKFNMVGINKILNRTDMKYFEQAIKKTIEDKKNVLNEDISITLTVKANFNDNDTSVRKLEYYGEIKTQNTENASKYFYNSLPQAPTGG